MKLLLVLVVIMASVGIGMYSQDTSTQGFILSENANYANSSSVNVSNKTSAYILQGDDIADIHTMLETLGASVSQNFPMINAVAAMLTPEQVSEIQVAGNFRLQHDRTVMTTSDTFKPERLYLSLNDYGYDDYADESRSGITLQKQ